MSEEKPIKVLHVEDDKSIHLLVKLVLEEEGFKVFSAFDALQGITMARQLEPDLVVLDVMMPAGGGGSVYDRIRMLNNTFHIPILIYSATPIDEIKKRVKIGPRTVILQKPAPNDELVKAVQELLNSK